VFAVGDFGTIVRFDGSNWVAQKSGVDANLKFIWGSSATAIYAVGDGSTIWCYVVTGASPATIPWSMFKTTCWDPLGGTAYAKQPISNITLLVPGGAVETPNVSLSFANLSEY